LGHSINLPSEKEGLRKQTFRGGGVEEKVGAEPDARILKTFKSERRIICAWEVAKTA